mmetsp:Transcript_22560/g.37239  ORF Transcript_22560/g.37239 Transcript_22560/m.37239 type:complete len:151 (+) Transcript_22560:142-594(+)|eukprot:CAMPEP_0184650678 /NCGR_PEP_ID=MMETSP0308-20130426/8250_1 /TAXON_ID=38269 /ORGANISM="Gloeochaete witrockiana, Strain SAG 46.84" /LENGTH=150 /DNA_ID=CAMNT_0027084399 /DNA_START=75 /DNA_END=527 /DNA_ORIENTATION=-
MPMAAFLSAYAATSSSLRSPLYSFSSPISPTGCFAGRQSSVVANRRSFSSSFVHSFDSRARVFLVPCKPHLVDVSCNLSEGDANITSPPPAVVASPPPAVGSEEKTPFIRFAMRNMVQQRVKSLYHLALTMFALLSFLVGLAYLTKPPGV